MAWVDFVSLMTSVIGNVGEPGALAQQADPFLLMFLIIVGGIVPFYLGLLPALNLKNWVETRKNFVKGVSMGFVLFIFYDLLLESGTLGLGARNAWIQAMLIMSFAFGFLFLMALENLFRKKPEKTVQSTNLLPVAFLWALGLAFHSIAEGVIIGHDFFEGGLILTATQALSFALHKAFEGFTVAVLLSSERKAESRDIALIGVTASVPLILAPFLSLIENISAFSTYFFAIGGGASIYALLHMTDFSGREKMSFRQTLGVLLGIILWYLAGLLHEI